MTIRRPLSRGTGAGALDTRASAERRAPTGVFGGRPGSALAIVVTQPPLPDSIPTATLAARQVTKRRPGQRFGHGPVCTSKMISWTKTGGSALPGRRPFGKTAVRPGTSPGSEGLRCGRRTCR